MARSNNDERRGPRWPVAVAAWVSGPISGPAALRDVSSGGARIESAIPLRTGMRVMLSVALGGQVVSCRARVVRTDGAAAGVRFLEAQCHM